MMHEQFQQVAELAAGLPVAGFALVGLVKAARYIRASPAEREVMRTAARIKRTWRRTAVRVGLKVTEQIGAPGAAPARHRVLTPAVKVRREEWGVLIEAMTVGRLGLEEFTDVADHLADAWRVPRVSVEQREPGRVRLRAVVRDPLAEPSVWGASAGGATVDPGTWPLGVDADGQPVVLRTKNVSGVVVAGLAGYGKTSLLDARFCQLVGQVGVQFAVIDGKGGPDWDDHHSRLFAHCKDDPQQARDILARIHRLMGLRQSWIRRYLGVKNFWDLSIYAEWPLVMVVIDEAHTFFHETKGADPESRRRDGLARETIRLVEELVRKGRNVGIQVVLATQKATGDAIPTRIRDNCQIAISFAQRTSEAATAALGSDITAFPDAHPRRLQEAKYVGVASVVAEGRPGFTLVRTPLVPAGAAWEVAEQSRWFTRDPLVVLEDALAVAFKGWEPGDVTPELAGTGGERG
jgi:S-DNA-T family DNA segregation ATPase FtsK/SpoIIIE